MFVKIQSTSTILFVLPQFERLPDVTRRWESYQGGRLSTTKSKMSHSFKMWNKFSQIVERNKSCPEPPAVQKLNPGQTKEKVTACGKRAEGINAFFFFRLQLQSQTLLQTHCTTVHSLRGHRATQSEAAASHWPVTLILFTSTLTQLEMGRTAITWRCSIQTTLHIYSVCSSVWIPVRNAWQELRFVKARCFSDTS